MNFDSVVKQIFGKLKLIGGTDGTPIGNVGDALKIAGTIMTAAPEGLADTGNSSTTPLGADATFTGAAIDIKDYSAINVAAFSDVSSATDGLKMQFSPDGTNWDHQHTFSVTGGVGVSYAQSSELRYFRIVYVNGATPQTFFRLTTVLKASNVSPSRYTVAQTLTGGQMADVTKSIIWGLSSSGGGTYVPTKVTPSGSLTTAIGDITGVVGQNTMANSLPVTIASNQSTIPIKEEGAVVSTVNSTSTPLTAGQTFTGTSEDVTQYGVINIVVRSDVASAIDGLQFLFSTDNVNFYSSDEYTIGAGKFKTYSIAPIARYFKVQYQNGATNQASFLLQTIYRRNYVKPSSHRLADALSSQDDAEVTQSVLVAKLPSGEFENIRTTTEGHLIVENENNGIVSTVNSTSTPLGIGGTFTGDWEDILNYASISVLGTTNVVGTLYGESSSDGINVDRSTLLTDGTSNIGVHNLIPVARYFRVRYVNDGVAQTTFRLQTIYNKSGRIAIPTSRLTQTINDFTDVLNTRSAITAKTASGAYRNIETDSEGDLDVHITNPSTAFGEVNVAQDTPVAQIDFVYGANTNVTQTSVTGSGTVTTANALLSVNTTAATNSSAQLTSLRYAKYRPGQGIKARFTALFTAGATGSQQLAGMGDPALSNGFFFGYDDDLFGIIYYNAGAKTFIPQTTWNYDVLDGSKSTSNPSGMLLDPSKGNVFQIQMQYLGFGVIGFYVESPATGYFTLVHEIRYANANTAPSVSNPAMNLLWRASNTTNATAITVRGASGALFVEGDQKFLGPRYGTNNNKTVTTLLNIFTLRVASTYNTVTNRAQIRIRYASIAANINNATGVATLQIIKNATLGGTPVFTPVAGTTANNGVTITNGQSVVSVDTAGTTVTGGITIFNTSIAITNGSAEDLSDLDIFANPGDTLTFAAVSTQSATISIAANWSEDI